MSRIIKIFDTTLRDGEQSPGCSMNIEEKLMVARQLARMKVDIIEAGFPIASEGDFEAVRRIAQEVKGPAICGLARTTDKDIDRAAEAIKPLGARKDTYVPRDFGHTSEIQTQENARASSGDGCRCGKAGEELYGRRGVLRGGCHTLGHSLSLQGG